MSSLRRSLYVAIDLGVDRQAYEAAYRRDEVPDLSPYGLHHLETHGFDLRFLPPRRQRLAELWPAEALRRLSYNMNVYSLAEGWRLRRNADLAFAWEERVGLPIALGRRTGEPPCVTGVLWLTDRFYQLPESYRKLVRFGLKQSAGLVIISTAQREPLVEQWGVSPEHIHYFPFGIPVEQWDQPHSEPQDPGLVFSAGNDQDRDHALTVRAVDHLRRGGYEVRLELLTKQDVAVPPAVGVRRESTGLADTRTTLQRAAMVVVSTRPNLHASGMTVVMEAMAVGRAVIASGTPGMDDYVVDGVTGFLVRPGNLDELSARIQRLLDDPGLAARMGDAGRERIWERHTSAQMAASLAAVLDKVT